MPTARISGYFLLTYAFYSVTLENIEKHCIYFMYLLRDKTKIVFFLLILLKLKQINSIKYRQ